MGHLTFAINVTLDGCTDHRVGIADDETHAYFTDLMDQHGAMLWGRTTYEMMEDYWPLVASGKIDVPQALLDWAMKLQDKPKYVVSSQRENFPWNNSHHLNGDLAVSAQTLIERTPKGVLLGSGKLAAQLDQLGLIDEYRFLIHPIIAGHGPRLFGHLLTDARHLNLCESQKLSNGVIAANYRRT
ncbi:dihydrofolate reductase family protein [Glutamicibacter sp. JC586]|uniref:dihydrofolate reductase family protein n=1 Tax=Glutamicibacter sp. JC586 TaxID=2590552 RepID=UPI001359802B|nr:dihydrofolate reductase family protein [Glutamicibacter sp. JC586]